QGSLAEACAAGMPALARVRSTRAPVPGRMTLVDGQPGFTFDTPEEGVAPGQACVLYAAPDGLTVLGGGFIASTVSATER
ncbi:MAG TPA: aminomethyltransferase beta-barrel domain-containing protein, partial [Hyphomonadaceae bacterium]